MTQTVDVIAWVGNVIGPVTLANGEVTYVVEAKYELSVPVFDRDQWELVEAVSCEFLYHLKTPHDFAAFVANACGAILMALHGLEGEPPDWVGVCAKHWGLLLWQHRRQLCSHIAFDDLGAGVGDHDA